MSNAVQENEIDEAGAKRFLNSPYSFTLREEIRKAAYSVKNFMYQGVIKDQSIPLPLITQAKGIAVRGGVEGRGWMLDALLISCHALHVLPRSSSR